MVPQLPGIRDPNLRQKVFTHKGYFGLPTARETDPDPQDNERLALLGASIISACFTSILYRRYPHHRKAYLATMRSDFVSEPCLAFWAREYDLTRSLRCHYSAEVTVKAQPRTQSSLFEAYAGALFIENGFPTVEAWLESLVATEQGQGTGQIHSSGNVPSQGPQEANLIDIEQEAEPAHTAQDSEPPHGAEVHNISHEMKGIHLVDAIPMSNPPIGVQGSTQPPPAYSGHPPPMQTAESAHSQPPPVQNQGPPPPTTVNPLSYFNQKAMQKRAHVEWKDASSGPDHSLEWTVTVIVNGTVAGRGVDRNKKSAKTFAAQEAIQSLGW